MEQTFTYLPKLGKAGMAATGPEPTHQRARHAWWASAVVYQIYIRSFSDGDSDGVGDIAGIRTRLPYLRDLGIDAIWITPWYLSPQADHGYDVTSYFEIDPLFGSVEQAEQLIREAHAHDLRVIVDIVPKHTSIDHAWFRDALAAPAVSAARALYHFRPGRGADGAQPPNNWPSSFGGPAWTRTTDPDGTPGEWYLHMHAAEQPDLNWSNPRVVEDFDTVLRFWFDRGVDGFRIDVARGLFKDPAMPDLTGEPVPDGKHPYLDREDLHGIYRRWRRIADEYGGERAFVAEVWGPPHRVARYVRPGELHTAFNFDILLSAWDASSLRRVIDATLQEMTAVGAPATWVLSNHDFVRHPNRYGRPPQNWSAIMGYMGHGALDMDAGLRRARAAALLSLALPGSAYIYQGEELGLPEVEDLPRSVLQDPAFHRSGGAQPGRDGCRVPLPWSGDEPPFGFGPPGSRPWLPQPASWAALTAQRQLSDPGSVLSLYRQALIVRSSHPALGAGSMRWRDAHKDVLAFVRDPGLLCIVNLSNQAIALPTHDDVLLTSAPLANGLLPSDTAAWLTLDAESVHISGGGARYG